VSKDAYTLVRQKQPIDNEKFYQSVHYLGTIIPASVYIARICNTGTLHGIDTATGRDAALLTSRW